MAETLRGAVGAGGVAVGSRACPRAFPNCVPARTTRTRPAPCPVPVPVSYSHPPAARPNRPHGPTCPMTGRPGGPPTSVRLRLQHVRHVRCDAGRHVVPEFEQCVPLPLLAALLPLALLERLSCVGQRVGGWGLRVRRHKRDVIRFSSTTMRHDLGTAAPSQPCCQAVGCPCPSVTSHDGARCPKLACLEGCLASNAASAEAGREPLQLARHRRVTPHPGGVGLVSPALAGLWAFVTTSWSVDALLKRASNVSYMIQVVVLLVGLARAGRPAMWVPTRGAPDELGSSTAVAKARGPRFGRLTPHAARLHRGLAPLHLFTDASPTRHPAGPHTLPPSPTPPHCHPPSTVATTTGPILPSPHAGNWPTLIAAAWEGLDVHRSSHQTPGSHC